MLTTVVNTAQIKMPGECLAHSSSAPRRSLTRPESRGCRHGYCSMSWNRIVAGAHVDLLNAPKRLVDPRARFDTIDRRDAGIGRRSAGSTLEMQVAGRAGTPANATVVVLSFTAVAPLDRAVTW